MNPVIWTLMCTLFTGQTSKACIYHTQIVGVYFIMSKLTSGKIEVYKKRKQGQILESLSEEYQIRLEKINI